MKYNAILFAHIARPGGLRRGDGAMAALMLLAVAVGAYLRGALNGIGLPGDILVWFAVLALCLWLLRLRLADYRYSVDETYFYAERIEGRTPKLIAKLPLCAVSLTPPAPRCHHSAYITPRAKKTATALYCRSGEEITVYYADLSVEFKEKLEQMLSEATK